MAALDRAVQLAVTRRAHVIGTGHGRTQTARDAVAAFTLRWQVRSGTVVSGGHWPETAASWLRHATRLAALRPDLWLMVGPATGWAQMVRRLRWSTDWDPARTLLLAGDDVGIALQLAGTERLDGLTVIDPDAVTWTVHNGDITLMPEGAQHEHLVRPPR
jgi:hypothetical protein